MSAPTGFDVRAYMRDPLQVRPTDLDLPALGDLDPATLEALTRLEAAERALLHRMRDFLVTPTHAESRVTAFLTTWAYEQHWLVQTLGAVLAANGRAAGEDRATALGRLRRARDERLGPVLGAVSSNLLGADVTGAQMLTSRLDTAVLTESYRRLGAAEPRLTATAGAVVRLKERHLAFFTAEARARLAAGPGARRLARIAVSRWQWPGTRYAARRTRAHPAADPEVRAALLGLGPGLEGAAAPLRGTAGTRSVGTALTRIGRR
ncbi:hypothetical protein [Kocuria turfanensis]|uniref:Uncharacterized protein n=1 Tax=Kocuria turfanensis TaxID=388357 RepID=A0A512IHJ5_9MICC|nr:hypothetical protein [Kocuria turfanensis]GEO97183.1 hypothetical protein KTU01_33060 [Kocuria turfanensis]